MDNPYNITHLNLVERTRKLKDSLNENSESIKEKYHGFISGPEMDQEYKQLMNQKNLKRKSGIINLTSEKLKQEYTYKYNYFKSGIKFMLLISIMIVSNTFIEFKYLKITEINISLFITSVISTGLCFALLVNINEKALLDTYGYIAFYLLAMMEAILFFFLFIIKCYDLIFIINELYITIKNEVKYPKKQTFVFLIFFSLVNIMGILFCFQFIYHLFFEAFDILIMKEKTLFQKQLDLNKIEKATKDIKIEFVDDESFDSNILNSRDNMKID
jgi:hypothetical protein